MPKRAAESREESPHSKRAKLHRAPKPKTEILQIGSSHDLRELLAFEQDSDPDATTQKLQSFKSLLQQIIQSGEGEDGPAKRTVLLEYLQSQASSHDKEDSLFLRDLIETWRFATQGPHDNLYSSVVSVLALLLKAISRDIEFRDYGNRLCRTILNGDRVKLFDRGLNAHRSKEHLISPCLRLLTEVVSFDGGDSAKDVYRHRQTTFQCLDNFLSMRKDPVSEEIETRRRPSVRSHAIRYLLANLRLQSRVAKSYILAHGRIINSLFQGISDDPPYVIFDVLSALKNDIAQDFEISTSLRRRTFNDWSLGRLAALYGYKERGDDDLKNSLSVEEAAHSFLVSVCTSPDCGLLPSIEDETRSQPEVSQAEPDRTNVSDERRLSRSDASNNSRYINNFGNFLSSLRPYANILHSELILACFRTVPALQEIYFSKKTSFTFDPRLTATWIGYSQFLLATMQLPIPEPDWQTEQDAGLFVETVMKSIMPPPLTEKVMTRCLNQSSSLVTFFVTRILNTAFEKLAGVLGRLRFKQSEDSKENVDGIAVRLVSEFSVRCPEMKHVIAQFRNCHQEDVMQRESIARLLSSYYKVIPHVALEENFYISTALSGLLKVLEFTSDSSPQASIRLLELDHLLEISHHSPNMQWWHKPDGMQFSPFTTLLKIHVRRKPNEESSQLRRLLTTIVEENMILRSDSQPTSFDIFVSNLRSLRDLPSDRLYSFIDNCVLRLVRKPVHYYDILDNLIPDTRESLERQSYGIDLVLVTIAEQWPFLIKTSSVSVIGESSQWVAKYMDSTSQASGNRRILSRICSGLKADIEDENCRTIFDNALKRISNPCYDENLAAMLANAKDTGGGPIEPKSPQEIVNPMEQLFPLGPPEEDKDHLGLNKWTREEPLDALSDGAIGELILCLCSEHAEIRRQALINIRTFIGKLEASGHSEGHQIFLLLGEVAETANGIISESPFPPSAGVLATAFLLVLADPLHFMYEKVNTFLNKGPQWTLTKLPSYWVDRILLHEPTGDDEHYREVEWLLDALVEGLRTSADMDIYRQCHVFERLISMSASPALPPTCFEKIVMLLCRCTYVDGSTTLITRCGIMSWIASYITTQKGSSRDRLVLLASRAYNTSDRTRVDEWSDGALKPTLDLICI